MLQEAARDTCLEVGCVCGYCNSPFEGTLLQCPFCDGDDKQAAKQNREKRGLSRRFTWLATRFGQGIKAK